MRVVSKPELHRVAPRRIAFFLFPGVEEQDFVGPWECFGMWRLEANGPEMFTVGKSAEPIHCAHGLVVRPDYSFSACPPFEALMIPGGKGRHGVIACEESAAFLRKSVRQVRDILTVCTGSMILSALKLVDGKQVTTHWEFLDELKRNDAVVVRAGERFVRDENLWTSGGIFSGVDLALAYIDSFADTPAPDGSVRHGDAGKVQLFTEYIPERRMYSPRIDLSKAPSHIRRAFA